MKSMIFHEIPYVKIVKNAYYQKNVEIFSKKTLKNRVFRVKIKFQI